MKGRPTGVYLREEWGFLLRDNRATVDDICRIEEYVSDWDLVASFNYTVAAGQLTQAEAESALRQQIIEDVLDERTADLITESVVHFAAIAREEES